LRKTPIGGLFPFYKDASQPESNPQAEKQESDDPYDDGRLFSEYREQEKGHKDQENSYLDVFIPGTDLGE